MKNKTHTKMKKEIVNLKKIKEMVNSAPTKKDATDMLSWMCIYGDLGDTLYQKGRELIRKEFAN